MHPFERNSRNVLEAEINRAAVRLGMDKSHVISMLALQLEAVSRGIENGRMDHGVDLRKARVQTNAEDPFELDKFTKEEAERIVEATAIAITEARGHDPKAKLQIHIFTGTEPFDHEDERGYRYEYAWRKNVPDAKAAIKTVIGLIG